MADGTGVVVRDETAADHEAIRTLHRLAFAGEAEARLVDALRGSGNAAISLVADRHAHVLGHVLLSRLEAPMRMLALAPVAVLPEHQRRGIGAAMIRTALARAQGEGWQAVAVLGDPDYYVRFGFSAEDARAYACAYAGPYFMIRALVDDPLPRGGSIGYPAAFAALE